MSRDMGLDEGRDLAGATATPALPRFEPSRPHR